MRVRNFCLSASSRPSLTLCLFLVLRYTATEPNATIVYLYSRDLSLENEINAEQSDENCANPLPELETDSHAYILSKPLKTGGAEDCISVDTPSDGAPVVFNVSTCIRA